MRGNLIAPPFSHACPPSPLEHRRQIRFSLLSSLPKFHDTQCTFFFMRHYLISAAIRTLGSRSALVNMEARGEDASLLNRKCVFVKWGDLSLDKFLDLIQRGAGAMVILLPADMQSVKEDVLKVNNEWMYLHTIVSCLSRPCTCRPKLKD